MKKSFSILQLLAATVLVLLIISAAVTIVLNFRPIYYTNIDRFDIPRVSGLDRETIIENYDILIDYNSIFSTDELSFPDFQMSETGRIHFEEVKNVFAVFQYGFIVTFVLAVLAFFFLRKKDDMRFLKWASIGGIGLPVVLGILIVAAWDWFFTAFHTLVFNNDYWIFNYHTDPVILILPDSFFLLCAVAILALVIIFSLASGLVWRFVYAS